MALLGAAEVGGLARAYKYVPMALCGVAEVGVFALLVAAECTYVRRRCASARTPPATKNLYSVVLLNNYVAQHVLHLPTYPKTLFE